MQFVETTISAIKSISQRSLALSWQRAAGFEAFPEFKQFEPSSRAHDPRYMVIWQVERPQSERIFRAIYQGEFIEKIFHRSWVGESMADVAPPELRESALAPANHCTDTGRAIYMIYSAVTPSGARIDCERMLLPFGRADVGVEQIIASMETISLEGDFDMSVALKHFTTNFRLTFIGDISAQPAQSAGEPSSVLNQQSAGAV